MAIAGSARAGVFNHQSSSVADGHLQSHTAAPSPRSSDLTNVPNHALLDALRQLGVPICEGHALDATTAPHDADRIRRFGEFWQPVHATGIDPALIIQTLFTHRLDSDALLGAIELHKQGAITLRVAETNVQSSTSFVHHLARFAVDDGATLQEHPLPLETMFERLGDAGLNLHCEEARSQAFQNESGAWSCETTRLSPFGAALAQGNADTACALMNLGDKQRLHLPVGCREAGRVFTSLYPLDLAGRSGLHAVAARIAREMELSPPRVGNHWLGVAARHGCIDAMQVLLERGAALGSPCVNPSGALPQAVLHQQHDAIDFLLNNGGDSMTSDSTGRPLLAIALDNRDKASVNRLMNDARLNVKELSRREDCGTLVNSAISSGWDDVAARLVKSGARFDIAVAGGQSTLHMAAESGMHATVAALLDKHVDVDQAALDGRRAIHYAAERNDGALIDLLIAKGAQVNFTDANGLPPPLELAVRAHATGAVKRLIAAGAPDDPNGPKQRLSMSFPTQPPKRETASGIARKLGYPDIVRLLEHPELCGESDAPEDAAAPEPTLRDRLQRWFGCTSPQTL